MKILKNLLIIGIVVTALPSCFLFRGGGKSDESCPAYGDCIELDRENDTTETINKLEIERKNNT